MCFLVFSSFFMFPVIFYVFKFFSFFLFVLFFLFFLMRSVFFLNFSAVFKLFQIFQRMCGFSQLPSGTLRKSPEVTGNFGRFPPEVSGSLRNFFATLPGKVNKSKMRPTPKKPFPPEVSGSLRKSPEVSGTKKTKKTKKQKKTQFCLKKLFHPNKSVFFQNANTKHNTHTFCLFPPKPSGTLRNPPESFGEFQENSRNRHIDIKNFNLHELCFHDQFAHPT